jgi:predicted Fe-Mo cluster-binding NifX family protein
MRICVPTRDDRGLDAEPFGHVGGAPFYTIVDTDREDVRTVQREGHGHDHEHGHGHGHGHGGGGCGPGERIRALDVDTVVCTDIGRRAMASLEAAGISVLVSNGKTVGEILDAVRNGDLKLLSPDEACAGHGARHGDCGDSGKRRRSHRHHRERPDAPAN